MILVAVSAAIALTLGVLHVALTFGGKAFQPRDPNVEAAMREGIARITRQTTIWRAWVGFNFSHSMAAILFGLVYGYLALVRAEFLIAEPFLLVVGFAVLASFVVLARLYWFRTPFAWMSVALVCYVAGVITGLASTP